jgi:hypothetical protein
MTDTPAPAPVAVEIVPLAAGRLSPEQARDRAQWVREVTRAALEPGTDYGIIPGTDKPSLLKPGAEMLLLAAGLGFSITKIEDEDSRDRRGVTYRCSVRRGDVVVAECDGYAGYDESRYFRSAEDSEKIEREYAKRDRRPPKPEKFVEYRAPWNTLVKMAQKRALVGATLNATAASGLFTVRDEDEDETGTGPGPGQVGEVRRSTSGPGRSSSSDQVPDHVRDNAPEARGYR